MNKLIRNAAAILTAGIVAATGLSAAGFAASEEYTASYTAAYAATVAKPSYWVKGAKGYRYIKLSTDTSGATIYYTTNGKTPTTKSRKYKSGTLLKISKNVQIKAIAVKGSSKSAVMTKTFKVGTVLGDVTGDGKINTNDYNRLKNYINGKTSYICKDNADVNGSGTITSKDLSLLKQYINGDIKKFPTADDEEVTASLSVTPKITVYKTYGGKKIELTCSDKDVTLYYTINGKTPSKSTLKYTDKFIVDEDTTIKCVAYKSGKYSKVVTREVEVDQCKSVETDTSTSKTYDDSIKIKLSCATPDSKIYYTTNGADPRSYGSLYTGAIELTEDTTVKAYSRAKGYADSAVKTFEYKVESTKFSISGMVWDDTPNSTSIPDGIKQSGETGINGISVYLFNADTDKYETSTTTTTMNGVAGSYKFDNLKNGTKYKVVFEFNGQKYRAYNYTVSGGNQAVSPTIPALTIKKDGAYSSSSSRTSSVTTYSSATNSSDFKITATSNVYTKNADNVNLALNSKVYGEMKLSFIPTLLRSSGGKTSALTNASGQKASDGDTIVYELALANNSNTQTLSDAVVRIYLDDDLQLDTISSSNVYRVDYSLVNYSTGYKVYEVKNFVGSGLIKGSSVKLTVTAKVSSISANATIVNYAEVVSYKYSGSCYDKNSSPENMTIGYVRESDEAKTVDIKVVEATTDTDKSLSCNTTSLILEANGTQKYKVVVENGTAGLDDVIIDNGGSSAFDYVTSYERFDKTTVIEITVIGKAEGSGSIKVYLKDDTKQVVTTTIYVKPAPVTSTPTPDTPVST